MRIIRRSEVYYHNGGIKYLADPVYCCSAVEFNTTIILYPKRTYCVIQRVEWVYEIRAHSCKTHHKLHSYIICGANNIITRTNRHLAQNTERGGEKDFPLIRLFECDRDV